MDVKIVMPGSGLKSFKMADKEADLVDPFFDSEEDEVPVDMEMVFEAMKHVPLPDLDYPEQDDTISGDPSLAEPLSAAAVRAQSDPVLRQGIFKRKGGSGDVGQPKKKGGGTSRVSKRFKVELQNNEINTKAFSIQAIKVESVVGSVTAAKVAAEVAPNVVTGGIVAETGPRPDFSLWTVDDDLLLKNAIEAGAAMEALAKGAMRFSRRFTVRELRERWRALLYDPEIAAQSAARMVEVEYGSSYSGRKSPTEQKNPVELARKRRANSIRTLYYKRSKKAAPEDVDPGSSNGLVANDMEGSGAPSIGLGLDVDTDPSIRPVVDVKTMESVDSGSASPKETASLDFEDRTFSQMFSLLAAGGVRAVIGAIPAGTASDVPEQDTGFAVVDVHNRENKLPSTGEFFGSVVSGEHAAVLGAENGQVPHLRSIFEMPIETPNDRTRMSVCVDVHTSPTSLHRDCHNIEEGSMYTVADIDLDTNLQPSKNYLKRFKLGAGSDLDCVREGNHKLYKCTGEEANMASEQIHEIHGTANGDFEDHSAGLNPISSRGLDGKDISVISSISDSRLISRLKSTELEKGSLSDNFSDRKDEGPCAASLISAVDHTEVSNAVISVLFVSPGTQVGTNLEGRDNIKLLESSPWAKVDDKADIEMEESDRVDNVYRECGCRADCTAYDADEVEYYHMCDEAELGHRCFLDDDPRCHHLPSALTGESCTIDVECVYGKDGCDLAFRKVAPSVLEPFVCTLNTQDTEIPNLDDALLSSPSVPCSPSDQGEYLECTDDRFGDTDADGYTDNYADADIDADAEVDADDEYIESSPGLGVASIKSEPENIGSFCDSLTGPTELGSSVDRSSRKMVINSLNDVERVRGLVPTLEDVKTGFKRAGLLTKSGIITVSASLSDKLPCPPANVGIFHQQLVPQVVGIDSLQVSNIVRFSSDLQTSSAVAVSSVPNIASGQVEMAKAAKGENGNMESEPSPMRDLPTVMPSSGEQILTSGEGHKLVEELGEEELDSDEEMPRFSDIEAMILDMDLDVGDDDFSARAESRRMYRRHGRAFVRSEQAASAAMQRTLNTRGALAILYGRHLKYFIKQTEVLMGRATSDNPVDIDLGREGRANKVSRQQANIKLKDDGVFYLRNLGRRGLTVNNKSVETGQRAILGSNCLIEVGGMRFIFETNRKLVKEHIERRHQPQ